MCPLVHLHTRSLFDTQSASESAANSSMVARVVFALCIVFGSLLGCVLAATLIYLARRHTRKKRDTETLVLRREASFIAGAPSVIDIAPPRPARRPGTRTATPLPRISIPSPELGSAFRLDAVSSLVRRGSSMRSHAGSRGRSASVPVPKTPTPHYESLFSRTSTVVATPVPEKCELPLRVANPSPHTPLSTIESQPQKPSPVHRPEFSSSRKHLVSSTASADSLFSGSTSTPPLSPLGTWSRPGTNTVESATDVISAATSVTMHKSPSQRSALTVASSPHIAIECYEMSPYLVDAEQGPRVHDPLSSPPALDRLESQSAVNGTPVTLSHFPFRFSAGAVSSPSLFSSPVPSSSLGVRSLRLSQPHLPIPSGQVHGLGLSRAGGRRSLPAHSTPSLKLKLQHSSSDEIVAIAFAPQTINFQAVSDAVHGRLGFEPRRVWSDAGVAVVDDSSLWAWLDEQYTQGHTRLLLHVE